MRGYAWKRPEETAQVMTPDGYLRTGDVGYVNERGYARIADRKKDMILVSGFNVYPNEIEDIVADHPMALEVAVVGVPDEKSGEAVKIVVVRKDEALTAEMLLEHCRRELTGYKLPRHVEFRTELPKTNVGKILAAAVVAVVLRVRFVFASGGIPHRSYFFRSISRSVVALSGSRSSKVRRCGIGRHPSLSSRGDREIAPASELRSDQR